MEVLGWELWLVDPLSRQWTGLLPIRDSRNSGVFTSDSDANTSEQELAALNLNQIEASVLPWIRVNFTLDD